MKNQPPPKREPPEPRKPEPLFASWLTSFSAKGQVTLLIVAIIGVLFLSISFCEMPGELMSAVTAKADISQSLVRQLAAVSPGQLSQQSLGSLRTRWPKSVQVIPCSGSGMSAFGPKAGICTAPAHVRFTPR